MRKIISALSLAALFIPALAHAERVAKTVKGQIAQDVRKINPGLRFQARFIQTRYVKGKFGEFSMNASRHHQGLPPTLYNVSGDFNAKRGPAKVSNVKVELAPFQPLAAKK